MLWPTQSLGGLLACKVPSTRRLDTGKVIHRCNCSIYDVSSIIVALSNAHLPHLKKITQQTDSPVTSWKNIKPL